jgi:hypothetical protein
MNNVFHCKNCGAEVTTELCPYCNSLTGIDISKVKDEYPLLECKEASLNTFIIWYLILFAFLFWVGLNVSINDFPKEILEEKPMYRTIEIILSIIIFLLSLLPLITALIYIIKHIIVKLLGKEIEGIVYGYTDNTSTTINDKNTKAIKILIDTPKGKQFIIYKTEDTKKKYKLNSKIKLLVYKKLFLIKNKKEFLFE